MVDESGARVAQADGRPLNGDWSTSAWVPGQAFADPRHFDLPDDLPPGRYGLRLGWYDPATGVRLTALRPDGTPWADDVVVIDGLIEVK